MLERLRDEPPSQPAQKPSSPPERPKERPQREPSAPRGGLSAAQRFVLSLMLLVIVCLGGVAILVLAGKIALPISF